MSLNRQTTHNECSLLMRSKSSIRHGLLYKACFHSGVMQLPRTAIAISATANMLSSGMLDHLACQLGSEAGGRVLSAAEQCLQLLLDGVLNGADVHWIILVEDIQHILLRASQRAINLAVLHDRAEHTQSPNPG